VQVSTPDIAAVMAAAMAAESRRREAGSASPGLGAPLPQPQPPAGPGVGIGDVSLPVIGEGYDLTAEIAAAVSKAYGAPRPTYADPALAGLDYRPARDVPVRRHVTSLGADGLLAGPYADGRQPGDRYVVVSPPAARAGVWSRMAGRLRRR
jgi:hypothetical protein